MADITCVHSQLWTGGAINSISDVGYIAHLGITAVVNLRPEDDERDFFDTWNAQAPDEFIKYLHNGTEDDGHPKPTSWFRTTWKWAKPILGSGGVILVHCHDGINRGPSQAYFLLRGYWGLGGEDAFNTIKERRPEVKVRYRPDADEALIVMGLK